MTSPCCVDSWQPWFSEQLMPHPTSLGLHSCQALTLFPITRMLFENQHGHLCLTCTSMLHNAHERMQFLYIYLSAKYNFSHGTICMNHVKTHWMCAFQKYFAPKYKYMYPFHFLFHGSFEVPFIPFLSPLRYVVKFVQGSAKSVTVLAPETHCNSGETHEL